MGQTIIHHDRHNAQVVRNALKKRNGSSTVGTLPLYYSDDSTLVWAVYKTPGVKMKGLPGRQAIVVLEAGGRRGR